MFSFERKSRVGHGRAASIPRPAAGRDWLNPFDPTVRLAVPYRKMAKSRIHDAKTRVIEALVLALSSSELREIVGTDALRSVLTVEYNDLVESGSFDLQQVWELLEQQPGFSAEAARAPMCRFTSWEEELGIRVTPPDALTTLDAKERALLANECRVPRAQLSRVLGGGAQSRAPAKAPARRSAKRRPLARPQLMAVAAVLGLLGFVVAGYSIVRGCAGAHWDSISASQFAGEMPIADAVQLGSEVGATLTDKDWLSLPEQTRRTQLEAALRRLESRKVDVLFLRDSSGKVCASAQLYDDGRKIRTRFP